MYHKKCTATPVRFGSARRHMKQIWFFSSGFLFCIRNWVYCSELESKQSMKTLTCIYFEILWKLLSLHASKVVPYFAPSGKLNEFPMHDILKNIQVLFKPFNQLQIQLIFKNFPCLVYVEQVILLDLKQYEAELLWFNLPPNESVIRE